MLLASLINRPIIHVSDSPVLEGNVNGPSLIRVPDWVAEPYGRYYLYFAHHEGRTIRLAYADTLTGPWHLYEPGALLLENSLFPTIPPRLEDLHPYARELFDKGHDGTYPHIASPDVIIDEATQTIRMYYHGRLANGLQVTRVALSKNGLDFVAREEVLGRPYMRLFQHNGAWYAIAMPGILYRSKDGLTNFEEGQNLFAHLSPRHHAFLKQGNQLTIFYTQVGDAPEHIKFCTVDLSPNWRQWRITNETSLYKPNREWEGANLPVEPSKYGGIFEPAHQLRDPAVFLEDGRVYMLYAVAGEQGIGILEERRED